MGAYLYYKVADKANLDKASKFLLENKTNAKLFDLDESEVTLITEDTVKWAKENGGLVSYYQERISSGNLQMTHPSEKSESEGLDQADILEMQTEVFEELNKQVEMKYFAGSCAFTEEEHYFTIEQMKRITNNGELLGGYSSKDDDVKKKFNSLTVLLAESYECVSCGCIVESEGEMCEECEDEMASCCCTDDCEIEYDDENSVEEFEVEEEVSVKKPAKAKKKPDNDKELNELKKLFDVVEVEPFEHYQLLTLKDRSPKANMEWMIWLQVKIARGHSNNCSHNTEAKFKGACKDILDWVDLLKAPSKKSEQASLFGDEEESNELEQEPESPSGETGNWSRYFKECARVRKSNLKKQYSFFELCDLDGSWYIYKYTDYRDLLPKSSEELIDMMKEAIKIGATSEGDERDFGHFWWDDTYNRFKSGEARSDAEIASMLRGYLRLNLVPYTRGFHANPDDGYTSHPLKERTYYRFEFGRNGISQSSWYDTDKVIMPYYDVFTTELIAWTREYLDIPYKDSIDDEEALKLILEGFFNRNTSGYSYDLAARASSLNDWKALKKDHVSTQPDNNGSRGGPMNDGYSHSISYYGEGEVELKRAAFAYRFEGKELTGHFSDMVTICELKGDEIYQRAFELFHVAQPLLSDTSKEEPEAAAEKHSEAFECVSCGCDVDEEGMMCEECEDEMSSSCCCADDCEIEYDDEEVVSPKAKKSKQNKNPLEGLKKHFDSVEVVNKERYRVLTLKDKADHEYIDWEVYLEVKVQYGTQFYLDSGVKLERWTTARSDEYMLDAVAKKILDWVELLKDPRQPDLELVRTPMPRGDDLEKTKAWCNTQEIDNITFIKGRYTFFELFCQQQEWQTYKDIDYRSELPNQKEFEELYKNKLLEIHANYEELKKERHSDYYTLSYIKGNGGLSDTELRDRVRGLRIHVGEYLPPFRVSPDLSYTPHSFGGDGTISTRYYIDGGETKSCFSDDPDKEELPTYEYPQELLDWVRSEFGVEKVEPMSDEEVLKGNLAHYLKSGAKIDFTETMDAYPNFKELKKAHIDLVYGNNPSHNGGGSGFSGDGYSASITYHKNKGSIRITQRKADRLDMNRSLEGLKDHEYDNEEVVVWDLQGDDIYKEAFRLFSRPKPCLFDFNIADEDEVQESSVAETTPSLPEPLDEIVSSSDNVIIATVANSAIVETAISEEVCTDIIYSEEDDTKGVCTKYDFGYGIKIDGNKYVLTGQGDTLLKFKPFGNQGNLTAKLIKINDVPLYETFNKDEIDTFEVEIAPLVGKGKQKKPANNESFGGLQQLTLF